MDGVGAPNGFLHFIEVKKVLAGEDPAEVLVRDKVPLRIDHIDISLFADLDGPHKIPHELKVHFYQQRSLEIIE